jgi:two-component system, OmpR family, phosphate regulon sensor histidine kinase PhoR
MKKNRRLIWRLYPSYAFIALASIVVTAIFSVYSYTNRFSAEHHPDQEQRILTRLHILREILHPWVANSSPASVDSLCKRLGDVDGFRVTIILPSGVIVGDSERKVENLPGVRNRAEFVAALLGETDEDVRLDAVTQREMLFVAEPFYEVSQTDSVIIGVLRLSAQVESQGFMADKVFGIVALASLFGLALVALVGYVISRRLLRPLETLTEWAQDRSAVDLTVAMSHQSADEIAKLYRALNKLSLELDEEVAETTRRKNEQSAILQSMSEGVFALDMQEKIVSVNSVAREWFSIERTNLPGLTLQETARNSDLERIVRLTIESQDEVTVEQEFALPEGRILIARGAPLCDESRKRVGVVIMLHDISELRKLESVRREFVANVSHELKTPITSIMGYVETLLLDEESLTQNQLKFLRIVSAQSDRLQAIIDDLLVLSRIENESDVAYETVAANAIVGAAISVCQSRAEKKGIRFKTLVADGLTLSVNTRLLEQALINLLDNAIKYSDPESTVTVEVEEKDEAVGEAGGKMVFLRVHDEGAGIPEKHLPRLFERFYRIDGARAREAGGSGLGLAIVKHIALAHKGQIEVSSAPGEGSIFTLKLPRSL